MYRRVWCADYTRKHAESHDNMTVRMYQPVRQVGPGLTNILPMIVTPLSSTRTATVLVCGTWNSSATLLTYFLPNRYHSESSESGYHTQAYSYTTSTTTVCKSWEVLMLTSYTLTITDRISLTWTRMRVVAWYEPWFTAPCGCWWFGQKPPKVSAVFL